MSHQNHRITDRTVRRFSGGLWLLASAVIFANTLAHAQITDFAGYNSNVNGPVYALAVQADGKALVGGTSAVGTQAQSGIVRLLPTGQVDPDFSALINISSTVEAVAVQSDGQILIGGNFIAVDGTAKSFLARLHADGTLDTGFATAGSANNDVSAVALQPDGKILIGGSFTSYAGAAHNHIARLFADGSIDPSFNSGTLGVISGVPTIEKFLVLPNGTMVVGGRFDSIGGTSRVGIARFFSTGTLDLNFDLQLSANAAVYALALQMDGNILLGGQFTTLRGTVINRIARVLDNGTLDAGFNPGTGPNAFVHSLVLRPNGALVIGGMFTSYAGSAYNHVAGVNNDGTIDFSFTIGTGAGTSGNLLRSIALQADGNVLIGGDFVTVNGITRNHVARLTANGLLDGGFASPFSTADAVGGVSVQTDGTIVVGGFFSTVGGQSRKNIVRLLATGSLDTSFAPGTGADSVVSALASQTDGRVLLAGDFAHYNGTTRGMIARAKYDGTLDTLFAPTPGTNGQMLGLLLQPNGKVLLLGGFTTVNGQPRQSLARMNSDASLDTTFTADLSGFDYLQSFALQADGKILIAGRCTDAVCVMPSSRVARLNSDGTQDNSFTVTTGVLGPDQQSLTGLAVQPDGRILIAGDFISYAGQPRLRAARLLSNGAFDSSFDPGTLLSDNVNAMALQADGRVIVGGNFGSTSGSTRDLLARLNADGSLDSSFYDDGMDGTPSGMSLQPDGRLLLSGGFTLSGGHSYNKITRKILPDAATQSLTVNANGTVFTWLRGGSSPELTVPPVLECSYHPSGSGGVIITLGAMQRIPGGWQITSTAPIRIDNYFNITATSYATAASTFGDSSQQVIQSSARVITVDRIFSNGWQ
ncbi:hypothetical protein [Pseudolysobacter antarcticus]|nr:hypothetical protein [Pseudolysobacter antarcticus]